MEGDEGCGFTQMLQQVGCSVRVEHASCVPTSCTTSREVLVVVVVQAGSPPGRNTCLLTPTPSHIARFLPTLLPPSLILKQDGSSLDRNASGPCLGFSSRTCSTCEGIWICIAGVPPFSQPAFPPCDLTCGCFRHGSCFLNPTTTLKVAALQPLDTTSVAANALRSEHHAP